VSRAAATEAVKVWTRSLLMAATLAMTATACARSNEATCLDRRQRARQAALQDRLDEAERLIREVAAECGPNSQSAVRNIEKTIEEKRKRESAKRQADEQERDLEDRFPSRRFVAWATAHPSQVTDDVVGTTCAEPGRPDEGF
jgi:hypothetical protein